MSDVTSSAEPAGNPPTVQILQAKEVSIPIAVSAGGVSTSEMPPEVMQLRADFLAGRQLSRDQIGELMRQTTESGGGGGNGNCNIC